MIVTSTKKWKKDVPVTKLEIKNAIKDMKNGKAAGIDNITVGMMKAGINITVDVLHDLLSLIWEEERIPEDWCKGLIVKLPKKGDLTNCGNWRGITLMPTAAKVMGKVIIKRISRGVDKKLRKEQAGFRSGRSTIEQIFVLRNIIEQSVEWNASLYICFIDYEKAFDSAHTGNPVEDYGPIRYSTQFGKNGSSNVQRKQMCSN